MTSFDDHAASQEAAKRNLWMHFTRMSAYEDSDVPVIVRGSGAWVYDQHGKRYLDGLSGLFVSRRSVTAAPSSPRPRPRQATELAYFPVWSYAHPRAIELAERLAELAPGRPEARLLHDRRRGGGRVGVEAGPAVLPGDRPARPLQGDRPGHRVPRHHDGRAVDHRRGRHQAPVRAAACPAASGCPTPTCTAPDFLAGDEADSAVAADEIERAILREGPQSVAAVFLEPVQNSGGCFPPPPATSSGCARSATRPACCSSPTR